MDEPNKDTSNQILGAAENQVRLLFERYSFALVASATVGVAVSIAQIVFKGANTQLLFQLAMASFLWLCLVLRRKMSTKLLVACIYSFVFLFVLAGAADDGLAEPSLFVLATLPLTSTIIWGIRSGLITFALVIGSMIVLALGFTTIKPVKFVLDDYLHAPDRWILLIMAMSVGITLSIVIAETQRRHWFESIKRLEAEVERRKRSEDEIRLSEERYRALVEYAPESISMFDARTGQYVDVNAATEETLGYSREELLGGMSPKDTAPEYQPSGQASVEAAAEYLKRAAAGEMPRLEWTNRDRNGNTIVQEVHLARMPDRDRVLIRASSLDITERKKTEERLVRSERELRQLVEGSVQGILVMSLDLKPLFVNDELARIFRYRDRDEVLALGSTLDLIAPDGLEHFEAVREALDQDGSDPRRFEVDGITSAGARIILECIMGRISWDGQDAIQVTMHDVTERSKFEELVGKTQRMEAIGRLTGGIAHDFNNLLAVIQGNAELLPGLLGKHSDEVTEILDAVDQGADLTRRLLTYASQREIPFDAVDIKAAVDESVTLLGRTLPSNISISTTVPENLWLAQTNRNQVKDAILNLAINARDAMPNGGELGIDCANVQLDAEAASHNPEATPGDYVRISVEDNGQGISADDAARVFEPFYTTKPIGDGTGLGLSMIYGFARQSGGHVTLESQIGKGSIFSIFLPRAMSDLPDPEAEATADESVGQGQSVLVIEDNPSVQKLLVRMVEDLGYNPTAVSDAETAAALLSDGPAVELIVSDVMLAGGKSGAEFVREVHRDHPAIAVVLISGYPNEANASQNAEGDRLLILPKPFRSSQLAEAMQNALESVKTADDPKD